MKEKVTKKKISPIENANLFNRLFFWWTIKLFRKGAKHGLTMEDIWHPLKADESEKLADELEKAWDQQIKLCEERKSSLTDSKDATSIKPSLARAILKVFWFRNFMIALIIMFEIVVLRNVKPILLNFIINYFDMGDKSSTAQNEVLIHTTGLVVITFVATFIMHHAGLESQRNGMKIRIACCSLIYRKSLKLSKASLDKTAAGQVVNLLSNDVNRFDFLPLYINFSWLTPIQIVVVGIIMWQSIGVYTLVALGSLMIMTIPLQSYLSKISGYLRELIAKLTDRRIQLMSELIAGIQVVKMYAWEIPFNKIVSQTRREEIKKILLSSNIRGFYTSLFVITERSTLFLTIVSFTAAGNPISAGVVFQLFSYFNLLQLVMAICLPLAIMIFGEALVSIRRIEDFLSLDEIDKTSIESKTTVESVETNLSNPNVDYVTNKKSNPVHIELHRVSANWILGQLPPTLNEISLKIKGGELYSLVGPVGAGKSSILNLLLQELPVGAGAVRLYQNTEKNFDLQSKRGFFTDDSGIKISYASQDPWLFTGTVKENILFGQTYDSARYQEVTKVCSLLHDFKQFPNGDMTIVGERGASLSGGQRARINLARAVYRDADIYLLDDPLSAVDTRVSRRLFKDCISEYLKGKTRILATHQIHHLKEADVIIVIDRGTIKAQGSYDNLTRTSTNFNDLLNRLKEDEKPTDTNNIENLPQRDTVEKEMSPEKNFFRRRSSTGISRSSVKSLNSYQFTSYDETVAVSHETLESESKETGRLSIQVYYRYFRAGGSIFSLICFGIIYLMSQAATSGADYWLSYWTSLESIKVCLNNSLETCKFTKSQYETMVNTPLFTSLSLLDENGYLRTENAIYIYTVCIITCIVFVIWRSLFLMKICMNASQRLHDHMFYNIIQATMYFFNVNPSGRILNRFSKDVGAMDELLPRTMLEAAQILSIMVGILLLIIIVNVWMIIPILIIGCLFYVCLHYYLYTAQDIKRLEGIAKSPVFTHVATTLNGLTTIRSSGSDIEVMLKKQFDDFQDNHTGAWYLFIATGAAFGFILDLIACAFISCVCYSFILIGSDNVFGASVGLAISQSLILTGMVQYGVRQSTEVQSQMTSVERIIQYTDLPKEEPGDPQSTPKNWPSKGRIEFKNVFLHYKKDDLPVLKDINITIEPGWKIGVAGRTGAGKSSLISALFRLVDDGLLGQILIDDVDTKKIALCDLRSSISIIPQEPVLFSETLRYNLDPFGKYSDTVIWDALREVELSDLILDQKVTEGGTNFSVGQRQLICLARALLRDNKILVLDEATANIDTRTDSLIQRAIRSKFTGCTVITIAHRLNTIIDSDRVLVLDTGRVMEFDSPYELIFNKQESLFKQMIEQTGVAMSEKLYREAALYHHQKNICTQSFSNIDKEMNGITDDNHKNCDDTIDSTRL
ncbi:multidrug resistance-associated protein 4-like [Chelonus insularis]|uniref:multidrug resistance-associated protein 4-like n=1 Tax=Chelonus insularis TaxID=460826 RepID=UPI00158DABFC|nr:multidrug resistance-associated protein 4-like [Chelonus insularis]XP_034944750.1 multidrug resistance-associated protein 4-like [Chelonus insularis]XP_034944751.1 multidrug resistance-associated protein 4-like [Chelonus insularis]XP_034944752.1 multidrug resistance-associated protein 4-like [Chelonus insularis]